MVFVGTVVLFVFQLFICQWRPNWSDKQWRVQALPHSEAHLWSSEVSHALKSYNKATTSSTVGRTLRRMWLLLRLFIFLQMRPGAVEANCGRHQEIWNRWGGHPLPFWPAEPLSPSRQQGVRACQALPSQTPGFFLPNRPSSRWVTCLFSSLRQRRAQPRSTSKKKHRFVWLFFCTELVRTWDKRISQLTLGCFTQVLTDIP